MKSGDFLLFFSICAMISLPLRFKAQDKQVQVAVSIEGFRQVSSRVYCSGEPTGDDVFERLATLGIKTIISVDGKVPDCEAAERAGLRYIHLPIGYNGVPLPVQAALKHALESTQGPVLIHCHHGKHRGPAAAVISAMLNEGLSKEDALRLMEKAGTGSEYQGLWRDVRNFQPPSSDIIPIPLLAKAKITPFVREMIRIDDEFEKLEAIKAGNWNSNLVRETTVVLAEAFSEARRHAGSGYPAAMDEHLKRSIEATESLKDSIEDKSVEIIQQKIVALKQDCRACHKEYRN